MEDISLMIGDAKFNFRAGLLIEKGNKVLVEHNPKFPFTTLPGGRVKTLEDSVETLKRELEEEMHFDLSEEEIQMKAVLENFFELDGKKFHEIFFLFKTKFKEDDDRFPDNMKNYDSEASYYRWIDKDKLGEVNLLPKELRTLTGDQFEHIIIHELER